jgi:hypothetical protein
MMSRGSEEAEAAIIKGISGNSRRVLGGGDALVAGHLRNSFQRLSRRARACFSVSIQEPNDRGGQAIGVGHYIQLKPVRGVL